jgi:hypothetical protein
MNRWITWAFISVVAFFVGWSVVATTRLLLDFNGHTAKFDPASVQSVEIPEIEATSLPIEEPAEFDPKIDYAKALRVKLLQTGEFHDDEVPYRSGEKWLGLFRVGNSYKLIETTLRIKRSHGTELFGTEVSTSLLRGAKNLAPGEIATVFDSRFDETSTNLISSVPRGFGLRGTFWWLRADGFDIDETPSGTSLVLEREGVGSQVLRYQDQGCDDCAWTVEWVGDLNRDGRLDFLIDLSSHYNSYKPTLFLSTESDSEKMVRVFAGYHGVGC